MRGFVYVSAIHFGGPTNPRADAVHGSGGSMPEQSIGGRMYDTGAVLMLVTFSSARPLRTLATRPCFGSRRSTGFNFAMPAYLSLHIGTSGVRCLQGLSFGHRTNLFANSIKHLLDQAV